LALRLENGQLGQRVQVVVFVRLGASRHLELGHFASVRRRFFVILFCVVILPLVTLVRGHNETLKELVLIVLHECFVL
jgi:hypothetical protein